MTKDIQRVVAVFVHLCVASVIGLNVAIAATAFAGTRTAHDCPSCVATAIMLTAPMPLASLQPRLRTAAVAVTQDR